LLQASIESESKANQAAERERVAQAAERRAAAYAQARALEEQRRSQLQSKLNNAEELLRQKEELRQLEVQIKVMRTWCLYSVDIVGTWQMSLYDRYSVIYPMSITAFSEQSSTAP
jgi:vacuolar-type H+-ATPase subunit I/STV1